MADESGEKTEDATEKRMKSVREKGELARSQDLTAWLAVGTAALMIPGTISRGAAAATEQLLTVQQVVDHPSPEAALRALQAGFESMGGTVGPLLGAVAAVVLAGAAAQGGIRFRKFKGKYEQFNLLKGVKNTFGTQALWNGAKALMKSAVVGFVLYFVIVGLTPVLMTAGGLPVSELIKAAAGGVGAMLQTAVAAGIALAFVDVFVVSKRNRKKTKMTKKEVKDEHKSSDGDPMIKGQRRARQMAMSRNRMIAAVPDADVVLVNPTHIAIALKYEPGKSAPKVVATGSGQIALKIREAADAANVPIVKDVPLARALHEVKLGHEIPSEFYGPVAGVLAFVMALKKRGSFKGIQRPAPPGGSFMAA